MATITELKCPYCGKPLTSTEYDQAVYEFKKRAEEEFEEQKKQLIVNHKREMETRNENNAHIVEEIKSYYKQQIEDLKYNYDSVQSSGDC